MKSFTELALKPEILRAVTEMGFETPTPVQAKAIPTILEEKSDLIALAQTGTGKTAAFGLPVINEIDPKDRNVQALILCPTRELCIQIAREMNNFAKYTDVKITAVYGGANIQPQIQDIKRGTQIIVGTPGRTLDLLKRRVLRLESIQWLVLDEADEMLNMGFQEDLDEILETTPETKNTLLFSATMPRMIEKMTRKYMTDPTKLEMGKRNEGAKDVNHIYYMVTAKNRYAALKRIADMHPSIFSIVFCRTRQECKDTAEKLIADGYNADSLHGDLSQQQRDDVMGRFRSKSLNLLIATDVAARGLDVSALTHVINFNLPDDLEAYVHRSGRTGRAGKKGTSIAIVHSREGNRIRSLEKMLGKPFERAMVPNGNDVCEVQLYNLIDKMQNIAVNDAMIEPYMSVINEKLDALSREDLIKRFVSVEFNRFLEYYKNAQDINMTEEKGRDRKERGTTRGSDDHLARMFISLGKMDGLTPAGLMGMINEKTGKRDIEIGKIDIMKKFSFFDADKKAVDLLVSSFKDVVSENGFDVHIEVSKPENTGGDGRKENRNAGRPNRDSSGGGRSYGGKKDGGGYKGGRDGGRSGGRDGGRSGGRDGGRSGGRDGGKKRY
jgi:ATP-dependent RNA helicase DeaD